MENISAKQLRNVFISGSPSDMVLSPKSNTKNAMTATEAVPFPPLTLISSLEKHFLKCYNVCVLTLLLRYLNRFDPLFILCVQQCSFNSYLKERLLFSGLIMTIIIIQDFSVCKVCSCALLYHYIIDFIIRTSVTESVQYYYFLSFIFLIENKFREVK